MEEGGEGESGKEVVDEGGRRKVSKLSQVAAPGGGEGWGFC